MKLMKSKRLFMSALLSVILVLATTSITSAATKTDPTVALKKQVATLQAQVKSLTEKLKPYINENNKLKSEGIALKGQNTKLKADNATLKQENAAYLKDEFPDSFFEVWEGEWDTTEGLMSLKREDNKIFGTYVNSNGTGKIDGTLSSDGKILYGTFKWNQIENGEIVFYLSDNNNLSFLGMWKNLNNSFNNSWKGTKIPN